MRKVNKTILWMQRLVTVNIHYNTQTMHQAHLPKG